MEANEQKQLLILQMKRVISLLETDGAKQSTINQTFLAIRKDSIEYEKTVKHSYQVTTSQVSNKREFQEPEVSEATSGVRQRRTRPQL